jgi:hypothetical protein
MLAGPLGLEADDGQYKQALRRYSSLKSEQGVQISRLVSAGLETQTVGQEMMGSHRTSPAPVSTTPASLRVEFKGL